MKLLIIPNTESSNGIANAQRVARHLNQIGFVCGTTSEYFAYFDEESVKLIEDGADVRQCDMIVSVGGDGTMLKAAQTALLCELPVFGINSGRVGFLCAFDYDSLDYITSQDIYSLVPSERTVLELYAAHDESPRGYAVNDITFSKGDYAKTIEFTTYYGDNNLGTSRADGIIVSTPTGSTGYSLSAGGPIADSSLDAVIITPICSHSLFSRSYVLGGSSDIRVVPANRFFNDVRVSADGNYLALESSDMSELTVRVSSKKLNIMTSLTRNFYDVLYKEISDRR